MFVSIGVRANIHLGGKTEFCPNGERKLFAADQIRWGGVVAEIFRDLRKPTTFGKGGGVVAEIFLDLQGVVAEFFSVNCNNRP